MLDEEAVLAVAHDIRDAADARRDDRAPGGQGLDRAHGRPLVPRRQYERVEGRVERRDVLLVAEEERVADDAQLVRAILELAAVGAVADHAERRVDAAVPETLEGHQDVVRALHGRHAADPAHREPVGRDAEVTPALDAAVLLRRDALFQLDPQPDHDKALARSDAECDEVVPHLRAHSDQRRRARREHALEEPEEQ